MSDRLEDLSRFIRMGAASCRQRRLNDCEIVLRQLGEAAVLRLHRFGDRSLADEVRRQAGDVFRVDARRQPVGKLRESERALIIGACLRLLRRVDRGARLLKR